MVFTYSNANVYIRYLCNSIRFSIVVFAAAVFRTELPLQLGEFASSVCFVAIAVLPIAGLHVGEIISKAIMNMVAYILGALLGYGLRTFSENEIGIVFLLALLFILIPLGIFVRSVIKKVKDGYDYVPTAFLMAMFSALVYPLGPGWLTNQFDRNIKTLVIAYALTILSVLLLPFFVGDVHNGLHKNISTLADIFKDLNEKCFGKLMLQNLQDKLFLQKLESLIDSKEKSKFRIWELRWHPHPHPQEQYEKIRDLIRRCALTIISLSTTVENLHFSTHLRDTCKEICSESAKALTLLSDSMKDKTAPKPSIDNHLTAAQDLASCLIIKNKLELTAALKLTSHPDYTIQYTALKLELHPYNTLELTNAIVIKLASHRENMLELNVALSLTSYLEEISHITSHLVASVKIIKMLNSSIKELSDVVPFKQCEQDSNVPKRFIPGIQEMATRAKQLLVAPMKSMVSRLFAYLKKLITKCSFASDAPDTIQAPVNLVPLGKSETQREELAHVTIDINPPPACWPNLS